MPDIRFRLARPGEDAAILDFINTHFDMHLPLIDRPEFYNFYFAGPEGGAPLGAQGAPCASAATEAGITRSHPEPGS